MGEELKAIFYQENEEDARRVADAFCLKYERDYPSAVECLRRDFDACLTFYSFPPSHWKAIRTTNAIVLGHGVKQVEAHLSLEGHQDD